MKKHFLRVLTVMLMVCLGIGVLAACGDNEEPETPPADDPIEGVWTGATGNMAGTTLTLDVDGDTMHMVVKTPGSYVYYAFTKAADGSFTYSPSAAMGTITLSLNAENKLEYKYTPGTEGGKAETFTYETKAALPATPNITGTKYTTYNETEATITFGATPAITYDGDPLDNVKAIDVGGFKVFTGEVTGYATVTAIIYKDGNINKAYITLSGDFPGQGETCILSDTAPTPATADPMDGVWTGASSHDTDFTALVKINNDKAYVVIEAVYDEELGVYGRALDKQPDGSYKFVQGDYSFTGKIDAQDHLIVTLPAAFFHESGDDVTLTFTNKATLPAGLGLTGTRYAAMGAYLYTVDFTAKTMTVDDAAFPGTVTFIDVGNYTLIVAAITNSGTTCFPVGKHENDYYIFVESGLSQPEAFELVTEKPTIVSYTVKFSGGDHGNVQTPTYHSKVVEGERIHINDPIPDPNYTFAGWTAKGKAVNLDNRFYTVDPEDADENNVITLTAYWNEEGYTTDFNVQAQILQSFNAGSLARKIVNGKKVTLEVTVASNIADVYYGLLLDVNMNDDWYRLRMDAAAFTYSEKNSWASPGGALDKWNATYTSGDINNYKGMNGAIIVAEASLNSNVLTYTVSVYAATDTAHATPIVVTQHTVTSTANITELTLNFYYDPAGVSITAAKITYPTPTVG